MSWWNSDWKYRKKLTFTNNAFEAFTDFPVLVHLKDGGGNGSIDIEFDEIKADGADIRFVDDNDTDELKYEIERWDDTGEEAWIWVKVPSLAKSDTDFIYIYWGNAAASDNQEPTEVWDSHFKMVHHLQDKSIDVSLTEESSVDDVVCHQGVATDGSNLYISTSSKIVKRTMAGVFVTEVVDTHLEGTDMAQTNHLCIHEGKIYIGANNYDTEPKLGYIKVFNLSDLSYDTEHQVLAHWCEGCAYHDGYFWVVYTDYKYVSKYNTSWEHQADYALDYPTTGNAGIIGYQGITWKGEDIYCTIHDGASPSPSVDRYRWTGSGFARRGRLTPPANANQGLCYLSSNDRFYIAQRHHPIVDQHSVTITELSTAVRLEDSTINYNIGTKKGAGEPAEATGKIGKGQNFDGVNDYINIPDEASIKDFAEITIEAILITTEVPVAANRWFISKDAAGNNQGDASFCIGGEGAVYLNDQNNAVTVHANDSVASGTPRYVVFTLSSSVGYRIYDQGVVQEDTDPTLGNTIWDNNTPLQLGSVSSGGTEAYCYEGILDEVRISDVARSANWIAAQYKSMTDDYITAGSKEEEPEPEVAVQTLVQAVLISIPPLIVWPTLREILRLTGGC